MLVSDFYAKVLDSERLSVHFEHVDISVAIASERGLVTPVLRGVETTSLSAISTQVKAFVASLEPLQNRTRTIGDMVQFERAGPVGDGAAEQVGAALKAGTAVIIGVFPADARLAAQPGFGMAGGPRRVRSPCTL